MSALIDTGPIVAAADRADPDHESVTGFLRGYAGQLLVVDTVLAEVSHLISRPLGAEIEARVLSALTRPPFSLIHISDEDLERACEIIVDYADNPIGFVDASIVAIAERLRIEDVVTLDHRHFRPIRPRHCAALNLLPAI